MAISDIRIQELLTKLQQICLRTLHKNLQGIYIHGSLAFGCFVWEKSDIDVLLVTEILPTQEEKEKLLKELLQLNTQCPPKGIEMSLVLERYVREFCYPTPFELHYSDVHKTRCEQNLAEYCEQMKGADKDLAAHITVTKKAGITLYGKPAAQMFGDVPREAYLDSLYYDIEHATEDILEDPVYYILNLCRILAYAREELVLSKAEGADWMKQKEFHSLPEGAFSLIEAAQKNYQEGIPFLTENHLLPEQLKAFAEAMKQEIKLSQAAIKQ